MPQSAAVSAALAARLQGRGRGRGARGSTPSRRSGRLAAHRPHLQVGLPLLHPALPRSALVDVVGEHGAGKTALLLHIAANGLADTPEAQGVDVVWFDLNGSFDAGMLQRSLRPLVPEGSDAESFIKESFSRLHIYAPHNSLSLLCTLHSLFEFLHSPVGARVRILLIDALGVQHYVDAARHEASRREVGTTDDLEHAVTAVLRRLLQTFDVDCFVAKCALFEPVRLSTAVEWPFDAALCPAIPPDFMPSIWAALFPHVLVVYRAAGTRMLALFRKPSSENASPSSQTGLVPAGVLPFSINDNGLSFGDPVLASSVVPTTTK